MSSSQWHRCSSTAARRSVDEHGGRHPSREFHLVSDQLSHHCQRLPEKSTSFVRSTHSIILRVGYLPKNDVTITGEYDCE